jgi:hypothetical protein
MPPLQAAQQQQQHCSENENEPIQMRLGYSEHLQALKLIVCAANFDQEGQSVLLGSGKLCLYSLQLLPTHCGQVQHRYIHARSHATCTHLLLKLYMPLQAPE